MWGRLNDTEARQQRRAERWERGRRRVAERNVLRSAAVPVAVVLVMTSFNLYQAARHERADRQAVAALEREGVAATGTVTAVEAPGRGQFFAGKIRVTFETAMEGTATAWVPVSHMPAKGATVELRYVRSDPTQARLPGDEAPNRGRWRPVVAVAAVALVVFVGSTAIWRHFLRREFGMG